ncbi:MAG: hypothetical protein H0S80_06815 [Desulfovibrionaceae bacterium]|nr:hypothetical protein [Desulfovibrionaceae bacterium]
MTGGRHVIFATGAASAALVLFVFLLLAFPVAAPARDEEYDLDFAIPEVEEEKSLEIWGQMEFRAVSRFLDEDATLYKQRFHSRDQKNPANELRLQLKPEIAWNKGELGAYLRPRLGVSWNQLFSGAKTVMDEPSEELFIGDEEWSGEILAEEAFLKWTPSPKATLEVGKKVLKWGKGYAWNPVSFISRPKDVNDPDSSREGYVMAYGDFITSLEGPVTTVAFTPVAATVGDTVNQGLADDDTALFGGKLYVLAYDTDFDLMFMAGGEYDTRVGADFATNLAENFAIHGEAGVRLGYSKTTVDASGNIATEQMNAVSFLLGARYLTETDTTFLLEYYHNGEGYSPLEMRRYHTLIEKGWDAFRATGGKALLRRSSMVGADYNGSGVGRDYLYFRVTQKEPFDILYLTPTLTTIVNLGDGSLTVNPEVAYMATPSLELRPRMIIPLGGSKTEFGEKVNAFTGEMRVTYFF